MVEKTDRTRQLKTRMNLRRTAERDGMNLEWRTVRTPQQAELVWRLDKRPTIISERSEMRFWSCFSEQPRTKRQLLLLLSMKPKPSIQNELLMLAIWTKDWNRSYRIGNMGCSPPETIIRLLLLPTVKQILFNRRCGRGLKFGSFGSTRMKQLEPKPKQENSTAFKKNFLQSGSWQPHFSCFLL